MRNRVWYKIHNTKKLLLQKMKMKSAIRHKFHIQQRTLCSTRKQHRALWHPLTEVSHTDDWPSPCLAQSDNNIELSFSQMAID
jgi:hypothetical protein